MHPSATSNEHPNAVSRVKFRFGDCSEAITTATYNTPAATVGGRTRFPANTPAASATVRIKMRLREFDLDRHLFAGDAGDLAPAEQRRIERQLKKEMQELFQG